MDKTPITKPARSGNNEKLKRKFVLKTDMDHKQYSIAFTAFNYTIYHDKVPLDLQKHSETIDNIFGGDNSIFPNLKKEKSK